MPTLYWQSGSSYGLIDPGGGERYLKTVEILPDSALEECKKFDAMFLGAIGHPDVKPGILKVGILLKNRFALDQYISTSTCARSSST